ncbi:exonuclease domain-containing protein [Gryllotalpicola ginsengisoli]|uniref:exonuclease domain-containing protein n=1 Tax=Gryllotalpicola ginsengisoli TaxID=444608 RepID=UPI0003B37AAD|nr:exonuclease domain-containing protein [Gryllotalpicola ginsengisoli]
MSGWHEELGVFDLETTGVNTETARIVTAHVGVINESGIVTSRQDWVLDPMIEIPDAAAAVHGYTTERVRLEGMDAATGVAEIVAALRVLFERGVPVVAYNAPYDFTVLNREAHRHGIVPLEDPAPVVDPLVIDKAVDRYRKGKRTLEVTARFYGVELGDDAHDAGSDAIAAGRVAQALAAKFAADLGMTAAELHERQVAWFREQEESYAEFRRTKLGDVNFTPRGAWPVRVLPEL